MPKPCVTVSADASTTVPLISVSLQVVFWSILNLPLWREFVFSLIFLIHLMNLGLSLYRPPKLHLLLMVYVLKYLLKSYSRISGLLPVMEILIDPVEKVFRLRKYSGWQNQQFYLLILRKFVTISSMSGLTHSKEYRLIPIHSDV